MPAPKKPTPLSVSRVPPLTGALAGATVLTRTSVYTYAPAVTTSAPPLRLMPTPTMLAAAAAGVVQRALSKTSPRTMVPPLHGASAGGSPNVQHTCRSSGSLAVVWMSTEVPPRMGPPAGTIAPPAPLATLPPSPVSLPPPKLPPRSKPLPPPPPAPPPPTLIGAKTETLLPVSAASAARPLSVTSRGCTPGESGGSVRLRAPGAKPLGVTRRPPMTTCGFGGSARASTTSGGRARCSPLSWRRVPPAAGPRVGWTVDTMGSAW